MRIALIAPPFIPVPPHQYGGTELFIAQLARGLKRRGFEPVVYTNGEATIECEKHYLYEKSQWPVKGEIYDNLKDLNHSTWAVAEAARDCDVVHLNNVSGLVATRFIEQPVVYTIHHPNLEELTEIYNFFPSTAFVTISEFQRARETMPFVRTIHHGLDLSRYPLQEKKQGYLSFLGRIAPIKGTHVAIEIAQRAGIPLKIAGEVQPMFREYFEREIRPKVDGKFIEYVGPADLATKIEILGNSMALLFPIQWEEPFGLVMVEAMACGTPVIALRRGSVPEVVQGAGGVVCSTPEEMVAALKDFHPDPAATRRYVEENFSVETMVSRYMDLYSELAGSIEASETPAVA